MKKRTALLVFSVMGCFAFSQQSNDSIIRIDTTTTVVDRSLGDDLFKRYTGEEFNYETKTGESQNLLARFLNWIGQGLEQIFGVQMAPEALQFLELLIYLLMALLAIYLLVRLFTNESFNSLFSKKAKTISTIELGEEHIEAIDINQLLNAAIDEKNYRLAIRYQFLISLQLLSKKDIIAWHFDKTNADYLNEIRPPALQSGFKKIAYLYDYIWYGEQTIDAVRYNKSLSEFDSLNQQIPQ